MPFRHVDDHNVATDGGYLPKKISRRRKFDWFSAPTRHSPIPARIGACRKLLLSKNIDYLSAGLTLFQVTASLSDAVL
jgi:hypothetical protein